jgi:hypothetical protein
MLAESADTDVSAVCLCRCSDSGLLYVRATPWLTLDIQLLISLLI